MKYLKYNRFELSAILYDWHNSYLLKSQNLDTDYYINQLNIYKAKNILIVGAGTGRVAVPLSKKGEITALDIDKYRLKRILENAQNNIKKIVNMDMCNFNSNKKFDLIIFPYNTLQLLYPKIKKCLISVWKNLKINGICIFDLSKRFNFRQNTGWIRILKAYCHELNEEITEFQKIKKGKKYLKIFKKFINSKNKKILEETEIWFYYNKNFLKNEFTSASLSIIKIDHGYINNYPYHKIIFHCKKCQI